MKTREERLTQIKKAVDELGSDVSVKDLADELNLSKSYVRELAKDALEKGLIKEPVVIPTVPRETRHEQVAEVVEEQGSGVAVKDIADELDLSKSYVCEIAPEAIEKGLIDGEQSVPVLGYIFNDEGQARTDGGERNGELRVLTTRPALLQAVRDYAPHLYSEATGKSLEDLRELVKERVADAVTTVNHAWRFESV